MITVDYPPGGADPVHRHYASAFVYVLEGSIVMQMKGGEKVTLHPGDTFYEDPAGIHLVGKNASDTKPAKFLVFLVKDKGAPTSHSGERVTPRPGGLRQVLFHSEISFLRLSVGCESEPFLRFAGESPPSAARLRWRPQLRWKEVPGAFSDSNY